MTRVTNEPWSVLAGDGSVRRLTLDVGQINAAFEDAGDQRAAARPEPGDTAETYIDMHAALVSIPTIGRSLLGEAEYTNLLNWMEDGEHAILVAGALRCVGVRGQPARPAAWCGGVRAATQHQPSGGLRCMASAAARRMHLPADRACMQGNNAGHT